jgi:hypothetical protein
MMPIFRYLICVGAVLLTGLLAFGDSDVPRAKGDGSTRALTDILRSMAHHGEPKHPPPIWAATYRNP